MIARKSVLRTPALSSVSLSDDQTARKLELACAVHEHARAQVSVAENNEPFCAPVKIAVVVSLPVRVGFRRADQNARAMALLHIPPSSACLRFVGSNSRRPKSRHTMHATT